MKTQPDQDSKVAYIKLPEQSLKALLLSDSARTELELPVHGRSKRRALLPL